MAVRDSPCDRFALKQFTHVHGSYLLRDEWEALQARIRMLLQGNLLEEFQFLESNFKVAFFD
jgi:hypothetical protein